MIKLHKKIKKAILYYKINYNNANYCGTNMMSQINAPIQGYTNPLIYYQFKINKRFGNFYLVNKTSYIDSDHILRSSNCPSYLKKTAVNKGDNLTNTSLRNNFLKNLPMLPNTEKSGEPNPSNTNILQSNFECGLQLGAVHPRRCNRDVKFMKICTIL